MSKKCKKAPAGPSFSGALSATIRFLPEDGTSDTSIPSKVGHCQNPTGCLSIFSGVLSATHLSNHIPLPWK